MGAKPVLVQKMCLLKLPEWTFISLETEIRKSEWKIKCSYSAGLYILTRTQFRFSLQSAFTIKCISLMVGYSLKTTEVIYILKGRLRCYLLVPE